MSLLVTVEVLLDVFEDGESATLDQLVEGKGVLRVVDFALQHRVEVLKVDVCVLDQGLSRLAHEHNLHSAVYLVQQDVDYLQDEIRLDRHEYFRVEVRLQTLGHFVEEARDLTVEGWPLWLQNN